ncbi:MAG: peptide chain release factor N(5)-glutamine methyltransferase [Chitinophagia bacterium]|nr:peptide chain release factor N(5)-glutamine methyltransferase [Chitinophagia bacterium]
MFYFWMMRMKEAYQLIQQRLQSMYEPREASQIAEMVIEKITGYTRTERLVHHEKLLNADQAVMFEQDLKELEGGRPVQYVLGECWFQNMLFKVDERVLIPRPETEELVESIKAHYNNNPCSVDNPCKLIDIGTGSGCIAVSLKKAFPLFEVWAVDKSIKALELAKENANKLDAKISFKQSDILEESKNDSLPAFNIIVSNPPYIPQDESKELEKHVIAFEPNEALFVTNQDPLEFYKAIVEFAEHHLLRGGMIFFETHEKYAKGVIQLLEENEFEQVQIKKDLQGKDRIVSGKRMGASL